MKINIFIFSIFMLVLTTCAPADPSSASTGGIEVDQAVVRLPGGAMPEMNTDGSVAGYLRIQNNGASNDSLISVQADFAGMSMLHKSSIDSNGVASMEMVMAINVPAGQIVELKPGDLHIMFSDLKQDLKTGDTVTLVLQFEKAGPISVPAQVTDK